MLMMPLFYHYFFSIQPLLFYYQSPPLYDAITSRTDRQTDPDTRHTDPETPDKHEQKTNKYEPVVM